MADYSSYLQNNSPKNTATHTTASYGKASTAPTVTTTLGTTDYTGNNPYAGAKTNDYNPDTVTAPTFAKSNTQTGTTNYTPNQVDARYSSFLEKQYSGGGSLPTNEAGQTAYDLQRGMVKSDVEQARTAREDALRRTLANMGLQDSGIALKQGRMLNADLERESGRRMAGIDAEELQAKERQATRLGEQAFSAEQGALGRETQRELTYAGLSLQEKSLFEQARQFDTRQEFESWATTQGLNQQEKDRIFTAIQNDKDRTLKGELTYADLNQRDRALAQEATQFADRMEFDAWAKQSDIDQNTADRIWQTVENEKSRENDLNLITQKLVASLTTMNYESAVAERTENRKVKAEYYYSLGAAGGMDAEALAKLEANDPTAAMAYKAGQAGQSLQDVQRDIEMQDKYISAFLTSFDPNSAAFQGAVTDFFSKMGVEAPEGLGTGGNNLYGAATKSIDDVKYTDIRGSSAPGSPNYQQYKAVYDRATEWMPQFKRDTEGMNSVNFVDVPEANSYFKLNGKLYYVVTPKLREYGRSGINSQRFDAYDVETGKLVPIDTLQLQGGK